MNTKQAKKSEQQDDDEWERSDKSGENGEHQRNIKQPAVNQEQDNHKKQEGEQNQNKEPLEDSQNKEKNDQTMHNTDRKYQDDNSCTKIKSV